MNRFIDARLAPLSHAIVLAWGWRRAAIAFACGTLATLALSPANAWPVLLIAFPVLVWQIDGSAAGRLGGALSAAAVGWWFGFGYFLAGLYWTGFAFLVDAPNFAWLLPFAVTVLPAGLAIFTALGCALAQLAWSRGPWRVIALAAALTAAEWLRGHLLTGFPWNAFGYALTGPLPLAQSASLVGLWGLTFVAVAVFASPAVLADARRDTPRPWVAPMLGLVVLGAMAAFGFTRLAQNPTESVPDVRLRLMQPNLQQDQKFNYGAKQEVMSRYLKLSGQPGGGGAGLAGVTYLIWPESAFPFFLAREPDALAQIAGLLPPGTTLITGAARPPKIAPGERTVRAYNSIYVIDDEGTIRGVYDKVHLVPFGEYLPFQSVLERLGLMQLTKVQGGFIPGERRRAMKLGPAPAFVPLICYEVIFPGEAVPRSERPGWLLNLTNDGWFGRSAGPHQHLQQARVRAIEEGLPLIRVANTGITAVVDPLGRVVASLQLGTEGIVDSALPQAARATSYVRFGDSIAFVLVGIGFAAAWRASRRSS